MQQFVAFKMARRGTIFDIFDSLHRNSNVGAVTYQEQIKKKIEYCIAAGNFYLAQAGDVLNALGA